MNVDAMVIRHRTPGSPYLLAKSVNCAVVNAGDGPHEHPTQGLLDILTIRQRRGSLAGLTVALVGDIAHSRTARSNIWGLKNSVLTSFSRSGDARLSPLGRIRRGSGLPPRRHCAPLRCLCNLLRIQFERQFTRPFPSVREYALLYAMNRERMRKAKSDILIMAPGPINRGVEITPEVADGPHSVILRTSHQRHRSADGGAVADDECSDCLVFKKFPIPHAQTADQKRPRDLP